MLRIYHALFVTASIVFLLQLVVDFLLWLFENRKQKFKKLFNKWPAQKRDKYAETAEQGPRSFNNDFDDIKSLIRCAIAFLIIIGGALFNVLV